MFSRTCKGCAELEEQVKRSVDALERAIEQLYLMIKGVDAKIKSEDVKPMPNPIRKLKLEDVRKPTRMIDFQEKK